MKSFFLSVVLLFLSTFPAQAQNQTLNNPINPSATGNQTLTVSEIVGGLVSALLGFLGVVSVLAIILSGLRIAFARGNTDMVTKGKSGLVWAIVGLFVAFLGYIIIGFVLDQFSFLTGS